MSYNTTQTVPKRELDGKSIFDEDGKLLAAQMKSLMASKEERMGLPHLVVTYRTGAANLYNELHEFYYSQRKAEAALKMDQREMSEWKSLGLYLMDQVDRDKESDIRINGKLTLSGCEKIIQRYEEASAAFSKARDKRNMNYCIDLAKKYDKIMDEIQAAKLIRN